MPVTQIAAGRAFIYQDCWGAVGVSKARFIQPVDVARGAGDVLYVANWGIDFQPATRITKCTLNHEWIADIGSTGNEDGQYLWPGGLALDSEENIYVTDQSVHKFIIFDKEGAFLGKWGEAGAEEGQLNRPSGIAFDKDDNLYVSDTRNHRVQKFTKDGKFLAMWGEEGSAEGQLNMPWGIAIDGQGDVYVADWGNDRVQKFSSEGRYLSTFGRPGTGKGELNHPSDVAVDKDGDVYVTDWGNNRVHIYEPDGIYLTTLLGDAVQLSPEASQFISPLIDYNKARARVNLDEERLFHRPVSVTVDDDYLIIIVESQYNRLQIYRKDVDYLETEFTL